MAPAHPKYFEPQPGPGAHCDHPVLAARMRPERRIGPARDIAGRENSRHVGLQILIDQHAVVGGNARLFGEAIFGRDADAQRPPSRNLISSRHRAAQIDLLDCRRRSIEMELHAMCLMGFANQLAELSPKAFSSGAESLPTTATSILRSREDQATSRPIKLAPITTARFALFASSIMRRLSVSVRR